MRQKPEVALVVLNWNNYEDTRDCLVSIDNLNYKNTRTIVVDNGSSDNSYDRLQKEFEWCEFVQNQSNLGFAAGNNPGIRYAVKSGSDYICLVNNDIVFHDPAVINSLVETVQSRNRVGILSPVIEYADKEEIWFAGGNWQLWRVSGSTNTQVEDLEPFSTDFTFGALVLMPREFILENDILPEEYFFGGEDMDISWQAHKNGWDVMVDPHARVQHKVGATGGEENEFRTYHETASRFLFASRHLFLMRYVFYVFFITSRPIIFLIRFIQGKNGPSNADIKAVYDVLTNGYPRASKVGS